MVFENLQQYLKQNITFIVTILDENLSSLQKLLIQEPFRGIVIAQYPKLSYYDVSKNFEIVVRHIGLYVDGVHISPLLCLSALRRTDILFESVRSIQDCPFLIKCFQECPALILDFVKVLKDWTILYKSWTTKNFLDFIWSRWTVSDDSKEEVEEVSKMKRLLTKLRDIHKEQMTTFQVPVC